MDKARVNHAIGHRCSAAQAFEVFKITPVHLGASRDKRLAARIRASKTEHLMPRANELSNDRRTDKSRCSRYKHFHSSSFLTRKRFSNHFFAFLPERLSGF